MRTLTDFVTRICTELDENPGDVTVTGALKKFVNTAYKEVAAKEKLEKKASVTVSNGLINKPSDYYDVSDIFYNDSSMEFEERETSIYVFFPELTDDSDVTDYTVDLLYFYIPDDLGDTDTPLTNPANDDLIAAGAKYIYLQSDNQYSKAEVHNRDFNTLPVRRLRKAMDWKVVR